MTACQGGPGPGEKPLTDEGADDTAPPSPPDADGDGHGDAAAGGDDCDDADPRTHPGAVEQCDYADRDCDGSAYAPGACDTPGDIWDVAWASWYASAPGSNLGRSVSVVGDLDGELGAEVLVGCWGCEGATADPTDATELYLLHAPGGYQPLTEVEETERTRYYGDGRYPAPYGGPGAVDLDGDGALDLVYAGPDQGYAFVAVRYGPGIADGGAALVDERAPAFWQTQREGFSGNLVLLGDVTGDGLPDIGAASHDAYDHDIQGGLYLLPGGDWRYTWPDLEELRVLGFGDERDCNVGMGTPQPAGDFDGDGLADVATFGRRDACDITQGSLLSVVSGTELVPGELRTVTHLDELDSWQWADAPSFRGIAAGGPHDWDGDGYDDLLVAGDRTDTYGALGVIPGGLRPFGAQPEASLDDVAGAWHFGGTASASLRDCQLGGDLDGDEAPDLMCPGYVELHELDDDGDPLEQSHLTVLPGGNGPPVGLVDIAEAGVVLATGGEHRNAWLEYEHAFGDVTGDGLDDIVIVDPHGGPADRPRAESGGAVWVVPGWEIPWEAIWAERGVEGW